ncbi:hypothetical protein [Fredinandcohnia sp. 179-A 10B2 NHS]|uniref:hypothetical protein n=1 Tax=Fredinandcohnia sp. 179-A 10B2 NHS TaxID=3235176 RepID=UPI00399FFFE9
MWKRYCFIFEKKGEIMYFKKLVYSIVGSLLALLIVGVFTGRFEWYELVPGIVILVVVHLAIVFFEWNWKI